MYTIKLDVTDSLYDKVMFFLKNIPIKNLVVERKEDIADNQQNDIVHFFQSSPLYGEVNLKRDSQLYSDRVIF